MAPVSGSTRACTSAPGRDGAAGAGELVEEHALRGPGITGAPAAGSPLMSDVDLGACGNPAVVDAQDALLEAGCREVALCRVGAGVGETPRHVGGDRGDRRVRGGHRLERSTAHRNRLGVDGGTRAFAALEHLELAAAGQLASCGADTVAESFGMNDLPRAVTTRPREPPPSRCHRSSRR